MTQPAVSHAISSIESELGVTILIRDKRKGLLVTDVGNRILVHIREVLSSVEKIEQEVAMEKGARSWDDSNWELSECFCTFLTKNDKPF